MPARRTGLRSSPSQQKQQQQPKQLRDECTEIQPVRSTVLFSPLLLGDDHDFPAQADSIDSTPAMAFGVGLGFVSARTAFLRTRSVGVTRRASEDLR